MGEEAEGKDRKEIHRKMDGGKETETDIGEETEGNMQERKERRRRGEEGEREGERETQGEETQGRGIGGET
jgi:hypothetical protein